MKDLDLVQAAQHGDKEAFAALVSRHWPTLVLLCRRMLRDPDLAQDAAQEAALRALLSLDRLRQPARFGAWLAGIGLNVSRQWIREWTRDRWRWGTLPDEGGQLEAPDGAPRADEVLESAELAERVHEAIAGLPAGQREAVTLFYLAGLSGVEVADFLGIAEGAVKTRLHKARAMLRQRLRAIWREEFMAAEGESQLIDMHVSDVRRRVATADVPSRRHVILLAEKGGERILPIWVGRFEGEAISRLVEGASPERPLPHLLLASVLEALGARVGEVRISALLEGTFYAQLLLEGAASGKATVDARPSDAISLALTVGAPIRADRGVLEVGGFPDLEAAAVRATCRKASGRRPRRSWLTSSSSRPSNASGGPSTAG